MEDHIEIELINSRRRFSYESSMMFWIFLSLSLLRILELKRGAKFEGEGGKFDVNGCNSMRRPEQAPFNPLWANVQVTAEHWTSDSVVLTAVAGLLTARSTTSLANYLQFTTKVASGASLSSSLASDIHCSLSSNNSAASSVLNTVNYGWFFSSPDYGSNFYSLWFSRAWKIIGKQQWIYLLLVLLLVHDRIVVQLLIWAGRNDVARRHF